MRAIGGDPRNTRKQSQALSDPGLVLVPPSLSLASSSSTLFSQHQHQARNSAWGREWRESPETRRAPWRQPAGRCGASSRSRRTCPRAQVEGGQRLAVLSVLRACFALALRIASSGSHGCSRSTSRRLQSSGSWLRAWAQGVGEGEGLAAASGGVKSQRIALKVFCQD